jgi:hypothetical protein
VCPIPLPGEWLQRGAVLEPQESNRDGAKGTNSFLKKNLRALRVLGGKKWPKAFRNIWLQNISFLLLALFSGHLAK